MFCTVARSRRLLGFWSPDEVFSVIAPAVVLTWLVSGGIKFKTLLQWALAFAVPAALVNGIGKVVWTLTLFSGANIPISWWDPSVAFSGVRPI